MRKYLTSPCLIIIMLFASALETYGQETVTGIVVDSASLAALPSVNVHIKNSLRGTMTDDRGNFSIHAFRTDTLVFTLVGYQSLELPLLTYEPGMIRLAERYTLLQAVTIDEVRERNLYDGMFDEQNAQRKPRIPFYFSKARKEKIKVEVLKDENVRVQTYVDVVVKNADLRMGLMKKHGLTEKEYYDVLTAFNEQHHGVMYYLTPAELISFLNAFFESRASLR